MMRILILITLSVCVSGSQFVFATEAYDDFTVTGFVAHSGLESDGSVVSGGCAIRVTPSPRTVISSCGNNWITFSCSGDHNSRSEGVNKYTLAQLAFVTGDQLRIGITDLQSHSGFCFGQWVQILN